MSLHRRHTLRVVAAAAAIAVGAAFAAPPAAAQPAASPAPLLPAEGGEPNGGYIVVLKNGPGTGGTTASDDPAVTAERAGGREIRRYSKVLRGFSAKLSAKALDAVRANPNVAYVRADARVRAVDTRVSGGGATTQNNPPSWGLDRIDQHNLPLDQQFNYVTTGTGATVYVLDSGIRTSHVDFGTRAQFAYDAVNDGNSPGDCHGHGTHVAGTIGGTSYGVAKTVQLRDVRVLDCLNFGSNADLIEGMDWVATNAGPRSVANLSLQNYGSEVNTAAENLIDAGVLVVFAAGNNNGDACNNNPRSSRGIVVGATTVTDTRWSSSNFGTCIDIFAPGDNITSAGRASDTAVASGWSGTSMAAPHVTGWVARYLESNPSATLAQAKTALVSAATTNVLTGIGTGSPNRLLYADPGGGTSTPANCQVAYSINSGGSSFTSTIVITNTGSSTINGWTLAFALPSGHSFANGWSATWGTSGQNVTATSLSWNSTLQPQQTATIGFNGTGSGTSEPTAFTLNSSSCTVV